MPVFMYGSEKSMDLARSSVAVIDEMIRSILPVCSAGISPVNAVFWMTSSLCRAVRQRVRQFHADAGGLVVFVGHLERRIGQFHADDELVVVPLPQPPSINAAKPQHADSKADTRRDRWTANGRLRRGHRREVSTGGERAGKKSFGRARRAGGIRNRSNLWKLIRSTP